MDVKPEIKQEIGAQALPQLKEEENAVKAEAKAEEFGNGTTVKRSPSSDPGSSPPKKKGKAKAKKARKLTARETEAQNPPPLQKIAIPLYPADFGDTYQGRFIKLLFNCDGHRSWDVGRIGARDKKSTLGQHVYWVWFSKQTAPHNADLLKLEPGPRPCALDADTYSANAAAPLGSWCVLQAEEEEG